MEILIIGGGAVSEAFHIPAAIKLLGIENVYVAEPLLRQQEYLQSKFGLQNLTDDYLKVLNNSDAVIIATPPHLHLKILSECFAAGKPVLCEKPISISATEGYKILEMNTNKVIAGMCHTYRLFANRIFVRNLILKGYFGPNPHIEISEGAPADWPTLSGYCFRKELVSGGVLMDGGIHSLDFILWCLGDVQSFDYQDDAIGGLESNASMQLRFTNGATANFRISRTCELHNSIVVSGNNNYIQLDIFEMNRIIENAVERDLIETERENAPMLNWSTIGEYQTKNFIDSIQNDTEVFCSLEEGIKVIETIENCYKLKAEKQMPVKAGIPGVRF